MKQRLVSLAIAGVMLLSVGGAVSAAPTNPNAVEASCHGQRVAKSETRPGHVGVNAGEWNKSIKWQCENFAPPQE